jgi:hypothetical protein
MARRNEELKRKLMAKAEAVIDEILANRKDPKETTLSDIEQAVLVAGQRLEQELTAELVAESTGVWEADESEGQADQTPGDGARGSEGRAGVLLLCGMPAGDFSP